MDIITIDYIFSHFFVIYTRIKQYTFIKFEIYIIIFFFLFKLKINHFTISHKFVRFINFCIYRVRVKRNVFSAYRNSWSLLWIKLVKHQLQGNELAYIYVCIFLGVVPLICAGAGYGVVKLQNKRKRHLRMKQEEKKSGNKSNGITVEKMSIREWLHANHRRLVKVRFGPQVDMHTVDRKGEKLRSVNFVNCDTVTVEESQVTELIQQRTTSVSIVR